MKKKGFTLIELLAVIVVLAIIALIATPIVMNTIKNSKKGAVERTADNYTDQVETSLMTYRLENGENLPDGEYTIDSNGNLTGNGKTLTIEMNGTKPSSGTIIIENGQVKKDGTTMTVGDYDVKYDTSNKTFVATESTESNVEVLCKAVTELSTQKYYDDETNSYVEEKTGVLASEAGPYAYGVEYTCELGDNDSKTFYVLENNDDTVSLIMNMNIDENGKGSTNEYFRAWYDGKNFLKNSTSSWTKLDPNQISLPSEEQISQSYSGSMPTWLYENLNNSLPYGYWTSTLCREGDISIGEPDYYCAVTYVGSTYGEVENATLFSFRPVITISKSQLG